MAHILRFHAVTLLAFLAAADASHAEPPKPEDLARVEQDLSSSADRQKELTQNIADALAAQSGLSDQLVALGATTSRQQRDLAKAEKRLQGLKKEIAVVNLDLAKRQDVIAEVLAGLQNLEQNPPPALVVAPEDVLTAIRSAMMFGAIVPELRNAAQELADQLASLASLRQDFEQQSKEQQAALEGLSQSQAEVRRLMLEKQALAAKANADLTIEKQRAETLASQATSLRQLLASLAEEKAKAEAENAKTAKARAAAEAAIAVKKPSLETAFAMAQGQIAYPATGQLLRHFGEDTGLGARSDGIVIATERQSQVISPVSGKVEFAGQFRSYGDMVILNPGDGYLVLLAGLGETLASAGQSVKAGEPVGTMGAKPTAMAMTNGLTNQQTPVLYVEFRHNGNPVDPSPWWVNTTQEAMR